MFCHFQKLKYDILIPNLDKRSFQLNEAEAAAYFDWFMEMVPLRADYVSKVCAAELRIPEERMDCSPESLVLLWKWFLKRAKTERDKTTGRKLTLETEYILRDIGMYLGETFRKNHPNICWTYYTKPSRDMFVNHPLLKGFIDMTTGRPCEVCFEPIHMARIQATKILKKTAKDTDLLHIHNIWAEKAQGEPLCLTKKFNPT